MSDWIEQYSAALGERDAREQVHKPYIDACTQCHVPPPHSSCEILTQAASDTKLADETAALRTATLSAPSVAPSPPPPTTSTKDRSSTPTKGKDSEQQPPAIQPDLLTALRTDLATTQKARTALQTQVTDLTTTLSALTTQSKASAAQIAQLTRQKTEAERKLRDRDDELRGKGRLVEGAQDEMVALELQLHMAEARAETLTKENQELVERWMKRMGEEVERVNRDSRWE